jgi:hypothetical protein
LVLVGSTPYVEVESMLTYSEVWAWLISQYSHAHQAETLLMCLASTMGYAAAAALLTVWMATSFDELIDRPRRPAPFLPALGLETKSIDAPEEEQEVAAGDEPVVD